MKFTERLKQFFGIRKAISDEFFDALTDLLVEGDFGPAGAYKMTENLREVCKKEKLVEGDDVRRALAGLLEAKLIPPPADFGLGESGELGVVLLLGVNGVGKTTTAAKLADLWRLQKRKPLLAAADTFRAAAIDQLKIHGERLGVRVIAHKSGGDPAAVVYDAIEAAQAGAGDLIIADTAGRMHTKTALIEELKKIDRIVSSKARSAAYIKWLVLDATTGRNALVQAETFHEAVSLDGVILTKIDSSAKGGVVFSLADELKLPVAFTCNGEKYEHITSFNPQAYSLEFVGLA
ncbi:MAG: signal recognition particle-docking protein FtsY [Spirochaetaceae bacterium]|jgi:fused signal recognition particle receptor|nr:signal recognition particle-docking protein FtsY [Spirochaetaceae bacterium]